MRRAIPYVGLAIGGAATLALLVMFFAQLTVEDARASARWFYLLFAWLGAGAITFAVFCTLRAWANPLTGRGVALRRAMVTGATVFAVATVELGVREGEAFSWTRYCVRSRVAPYELACNPHGGRDPSRGELAALVCLLVGIAVFLVTLAAVELHSRRHPEPVRQGAALAPR